jgi:hypothetical protein
VKTEAPSLPDFNLTQTFFGFSPEDRIKFHENLFNLLWQGEGRWDWDTLYNMPIHIRRYWITRVNGIISDKQEQAQRRLNQQKSAQSKKTQPAMPPKTRR